MSDFECFQSRNLFTLFEFEKDLMGYENFQEHIESCHFCREKLTHAQKMYRILEEQIPRPEIDAQSQESFESEVDEIMKVLVAKYKEKEKGKDFVTLTFSRLFSFFKKKISAGP